MNDIKPGDLVKYTGKGDDASVIMTVLRHRMLWLAHHHSEKLVVDVFYPTKGVRTYDADDLAIISNNHTSTEHAKLTALAFAGSCSNREGDCNE